jgi:hypothetical protein
MVEPYEKSMPYGGLRTYGGFETKGQWDGWRFIYVYRGKTYRVARLVCEAFHGPSPAGMPYCLHRDENAANNHYSNLKWGTQKENLNAPGFIEYCKSRTGERSPFIKGRSANGALRGN